MAHLLLSLVFIALLGVGFRSIWHDLTRPLVMQPWDDEAMMLAPVPDRLVVAPTFSASDRPACQAAPRPTRIGGMALAA